MDSHNFTDSSAPSTTPFDDEETLADPSATPGIPKDDQLLAGAISIYQRVWTEFYTWGCRDALQALDSLARPYASLRSNDLHSGYSLYLDDLLGSDDDYLSRSDDSDCLTVITMRTRMMSYIPVCDTITRTSVQPHTPYESCTPADTCISRHPQDPAASDRLQFIPYADDSMFDYISKMPKDWYIGFAWQHEQKDPDVELIRLEALRRLYHGQGLSISMIDRLCLLPNARRGNEAGILWDTMQRDLIVWPGAALSDLSPDPHPNISFVPRAGDLKGRIHSLLPLFCGNLSCIHAYCPVHVGPHAKPSARKAQSKSLDLQTRDGWHPCCTSCFRHIEKSQDGIEVMVTEWDDSEIADFQTVLEIIPDESPCNLAIICQKPCFEVYHYRCQIFPDENILETSTDRHVRNRDMNIEFVDSIGPERHMTYAQIGPCNHFGPCGPECPCYVNKLHCSRMCQCSAKCQLRWTGCNCKSHSKGKSMNKGAACKSSENCPCQRIQKECDPELCNCGAKSMKSCTNMIMQVDLPQRLIIKRAKYGSGAFASKKIRKSAFIGEYTGEIIPNEQHSDVIEKYLDLNYGFDHDLKTYIDGMKLGNETRYLNHPSLKQKTNVEAMMIAVNGDQRIALFAKHRIEKDEELLLDYGEKYWQHHKNKRQSSDEDEF